jgi:phage terminase large subunit-like protein
VKAGPKALPPATKLPWLRSKTPSARVVEFCRRFLTHVKGSRAGTPLMLARWQVDGIIRPLFDTRLPDGRRQYRTCYVTMPRKQGKSTLGAAAALYLLYADGERGGEIVSAAADTDQAAIVFDVAASMVQASPALRDLTQIYRRELVVPSTGSRYRVISAEAGTKHGMNLSAAVCDELHVWTSRELYDVLTTSTGAREQPLLVILTTAGDDEHGICAEVHRHAERVRDGIIADPTLLPIIYAAPEDADPWDEDVWRACNPALGTFRSLDEMSAAARHAKEVPGREASFRRFYLNQWGTASEARWLPMDRWDACATPVDRAALRGRRCIVGVDLSTTTDLSALVALFPDAAGGYDVLADFFVPHDYLAVRARTDRVPYPLWVQQGHLTATPGNVIDYAVIERRLHDLVEVDGFDVVAVAVDPWNAKGLIAKLQGDGVPAVEVGQTMANLSGAAKELERLVLARQLRHGGHPVLRWCASNVVVDTDANGNIRPSKRRSGERMRIDGISALVTGLARASVAVDTTSSVYDERDMRFV